jgi:hypothetical protein
MNSSLFWDIILNNLLKINWYFEGKYRLRVQCQRITRGKPTLSNQQSSTHLHYTTWCYIPEDRSLQKIKLSLRLTDYAQSHEDVWGSEGEWLASGPNHFILEETALRRPVHRTKVGWAQESFWFSIKITKYFWTCHESNLDSYRQVAPWLRVLITGFPARRYGF